MLGGQDAGHPRGGQCVALGQPAAEISATTSRRGVECACRDGGALGGGLFGDVDHVRRPRSSRCDSGPGPIGMSPQRQSSAAYLLTTVTGWTYGSSSAGSGNTTSPNGDKRPGAIGGQFAHRVVVWVGCRPAVVDVRGSSSRFRLSATRSILTGPPARGTPGCSTGGHRRCSPDLSPSRLLYAGQQ